MKNVHSALFLLVCAFLFGVALSCKKDFGKNNKSYEVTGELKGGEGKISLKDAWAITGKGNLRASFGSDSLYKYIAVVDGETVIALSATPIENPNGPWILRNIRFTTPGSTFEPLHPDPSFQREEEVPWTV